MGTRKLPKVMASSVIRSAHQGQSHGGVYIVDLETDHCEQVIDWNDQSINWEGRGGDRGLRGIGFHGDKIYLAASDEIFVYEKNFNIVESYKNRYLKHCHEIFIENNILLITSTGFDSILVFDLHSKSFTVGYHLRYSTSERKLYFAAFDPNSLNGPLPGDTIHINNVYYVDKRIFFAGIRITELLSIEDGKLFRYARIPPGTHNARPFRDGVLANNTCNHNVTFSGLDGQIIYSFPIKRYPEKKLLMNNLSKDHASQAFGRGLCVANNDLIIGGSSPATISVYQLGRTGVLKTVNLTMDVRNSIHGLEIWPS